MIYSTETVVSKRKGDFERKLNAAIDKRQEQGLSVEVQFQPIGPWWAALVVAKKAPNDAA